MKILIVDDEFNVVELIRFNLQLNHFETDEAYDGEEALHKLFHEKYDLVILDQMLPKRSGLSVLKSIRENAKLTKLPVLMLTAKSEEQDIIQGLNMGADDYITKPFRVHELLARVQSVLRRSKIYDIPKNFVFENVKIDVETFEVYVENKKISMTTKEFRLLLYLVENKNKVLSRVKLLEEIWGYEYLGESRTVDVHISNLRRKIEKDYKNPVHILTIIGEGYKFVG